MTTNLYFNNYAASGEQRLIDDLIVESIRQFGQDMFYIPRTVVQVDNIVNEDTLRQYDAAISIEMYIKNVEGFGGQGDFLSKFNLEIRDQVTFTVARKTFTEEVTQVKDIITRPREGDLIFFPLNSKIFEIKFVEHEAIFYQLGALQTFDIRCELFEYSNEVMNTGIEVIDNLSSTYSLDENSMAILTEDGRILQTEDGRSVIREEWNIEAHDPQADNIEIQIESAIIGDFSETDPFAGGSF